MTKLTEVRYGTVRIQDVYAKVFFSVADPGCLSRITDPTFFHPGSRIRTISIPDPGSRILIKEFKKAKKMVYKL